MKRIKLLPVGIRPRERLLKYGAEVLNTEELVAVILITGNRILPLSKITLKISQLIKKGNCLKDELLKIGMGESKTAQVLAAMELGKRLFNKDSVIISSSEQILGLSYEIINQEKESILCFYLNGRGEMLKKELIAVGSLNKANLLPREIFGLIKSLPVASIILVHNHPSGNMEPSREDLHFTHRVKLAGEILGVKLLDHLIVSRNGWKKIVF